MNLTERLEQWADARERRNPDGHGKTGTALLREAAARIADLEQHPWREVEALADDVDDIDYVVAVEVEYQRHRSPPWRVALRRSRPIHHTTGHGNTIVEAVEDVRRVYNND